MNSLLRPWHHISLSEAFEALAVDPAVGLSHAEAARRLERHGPNALAERGGLEPWRIILAQFTGILVVLLIGSGILAAVLGDVHDMIAIFAIVVLNALLGFVQEYRAEKAMAALKKLAVPNVLVRREGKLEQIPAHGLVPGDIILIEEGDFVPADARLIESVNLNAREAALTGESAPSEKEAEASLKEDALMGDRRNMIYMGTAITFGHGVAAVTATGMDTELGAIAEMIQRVKHEPTPLQRRLSQLGRGLAAAALAVISVVVVLGLLRGEEIKLLVLTAISLAVAAVPEGLPAVVTIALALGGQRILRRNALIRKLPAVESLGSVTVICSDKTGTLTENRMTMTVLEASGRRADFGADSAGLAELRGDPAFVLLLAGGALCNNARFKTEGAESGQEVIGDPTEAALVVAAARAGLRKNELERSLTRTAELSFDSHRKRMTTIHEVRGGETPLGLDLQSYLGRRKYISFTKGAADGLVLLSSHVWLDGTAEPLTEGIRTKITAAIEEFAREGLRVIGLACRPMDAIPSDCTADAVERDLVFVGLFGMIDPARAEAREAVRKCKEAGIRPIMITGDHPLTALAIARKLEIAENPTALTGHDLAHISESELSEAVAGSSVFARVSPEHKLRIVEALQSRNEIVAMTGDGVNDAPALRKADIGVAMGITGTDVSKEAADMVLLDDNFATIVAAVEEGRAIYDNILKFIRYLLPSNAGEICVMLAAPFLGMPLPLLPLQILWINLITDGLPGLALTLEPPERHVMQRPPVDPKQNIFAKGLGLRIVWVGALMGIVSVGLGYLYWRRGDPAWQTMIFTSLTLLQMGNVMAVRSNRDSLFRIGLFSNLPLLGAVVLTVALQLVAVYVPLMQKLFQTRSLSAVDLAIAVAASSLVFWGVEAEKWFRRSA